MPDASLLAAGLAFHGRRNSPTTTSFSTNGYIAVVMTNYDGAGAPVDAKIAEVLGRVE